MRSYFIKTYGCQMNVNDSENLAGLLDAAGFEESKEAQSADLILINTCCVRASAENKALQYIASFGPIKKKNKDLMVGVCGCIPNETHIDLKKKYPFLDVIFGPGESNKLSALLGLNGCPPAGRAGKAAPKRKISPTAWITIMEGCNNFCSFCIVPYVRGREISRPANEILNEIRQLDKSIYKEIVLLGQNVNSYQGLGTRDRGIGLGKLLEEVHSIEGIERIRFLTSHPRDMSDDIIDTVRNLPKVCEYFHIPLQSGDDEVLKAMNRGYTSDYYRELVDRIRSKIPDATITSDAIVGFPGETEKQFKNTLQLISELKLDLVNTLAYSIRQGTAAAKMEEQVPENIKNERLQELMRAVEASALKRNKLLIGETIEILIDSKVAGRSRGNKIVKFSGGSAKSGEIVDVKINKALPWVLEGDIVS